ncbi:hypothetical protein D3C71_899640 [compost metagenome]
MAAPQGHGQRIGGQGQRQQQGAAVVEHGPLGVGAALVGRQEAPGHQQRHAGQRHVDEKDRLPAEAGDQQAAQRGAKRGADGRHGAEQAHGAARLRLGHDAADEGHGQRHHDGRAQALQGARGDQQPQGGRQRAQDGGNGEQGDAGQQQAAPADHVAEAAHADDQRGDGQQVGQHDPLHVLERRMQGPGHVGQAHVGDAGAQRGQQHGEGQAGKGAAHGARGGAGRGGLLARWYGF